MQPAFYHPLPYIPDSLLTGNLPIEVCAFALNHFLHCQTVLIGNNLKGFGLVFLDTVKNKRYLRKVGSGRLN